MVSSVEPPLSLPCTRLPTLTRWRLTRPVIGASTWVNSTLSWAAFSAPSAMVSAACAACKRLTALVDDLFGDGTGLHQGQPAIELALGKLRLGARIGKLAVGLRRHRLERAGIDDVEQVAGMDHVAVLELDIGDEAADAGRTWTSSIASKRPVNSSQSVTVRLTGCATVTGGGAAAAGCGGLSPQPDRATASSTISGPKQRGVNEDWNLRWSQMLRSPARAHFHLPCAWRDR